MPNKKEEMAGLAEVALRAVREVCQEAAVVYENHGVDVDARVHLVELCRTADRALTGLLKALGRPPEPWEFPSLESEPESEEEGFEDNIVTEVFRRLLKK